MYNQIPNITATPTLLGLDEMNGVDGNPLDIIQKIAAGNYERFGLHLLRDDNGEKVGLLKQNHTNDSERVTFEILKQWLRSDTTPCTYQHLIKCVRKSGLGALATSIENTIEQGCTFTYVYRLTVDVVDFNSNMCALRVFRSCIS